MTLDNSPAGSPSLPIGPFFPYDRMSAKILLVDDEPANLKLMERLLKRAGYVNLTSVSDPRTVAGLADSQAPDLILLDINMPHLDGFGVMEELKKREAPCPPQVLVLTAQNDRATINRAFVAGARDFVPKPFDVNEILMRVANLIDAHLAHRFLFDKNRFLDEMVRQRTAELIQNREEAVRARDAAIKANRAKSEFLANMSHELRTPLNAILGFSQILESEAFGPIGNKQYRSYASDIMTSGRYLAGLIDDILDVTQIERNRLELTIQTVDLAEAAETAISLNRKRAEEKRVGIALEVVGSVQWAKADPLRCQQVISNLLSNAVKYTPEGGKITMNIGSREAGTVSITIEDNGIGIPVDKQAEVFEPFTRLHSSQLADEGGAGLGLSIALRLVRLQGGELQLTSEPNKGTRVNVTLPTG